MAGVASRRRMPAFAAQTFKQWFRERGIKNVGCPQVIVWPDAKRLASQTFLLSEFLEKKATQFQPPKLKRKAIVHGLNNRKINWCL
jgi:hypothetical protein